MHKLLSDFQSLWKGATGIIPLNLRSAPQGWCWALESAGWRDLPSSGWLLYKWVRSAAFQLIRALSFFVHNHGFHQSMPCQSRFELWAWAVRTYLLLLENRGEAKICCSWSMLVTAGYQHMASHTMVRWCFYGHHEHQLPQQHFCWCGEWSKRQPPFSSSSKHRQQFLKRKYEETHLFSFFLKLYGLLGLISCFHLLRESVQWQGRSGQSNSEACHTVTWLSQHSGPSSGLGWHNKDVLHPVCFLKSINLKWMKNYLILLLVLSFVTLERSSTPSSLCDIHWK